MNEPLLLLQEEKQEGNQGLLYSLSGEFSLLSSSYSLVLPLQGSLLSRREQKTAGEPAREDVPGELLPGDFLLLPPGENLSGEGKDAQVLLLCLPASSLSGPQGSLHLRGGLLRDEKKKETLLFLLGELIDSCLKASSHEALHQASLWRELEYQLCQSFGFYEGTAPFEAHPTPPGEGGAFFAILQVLEERFAEKITLGELAEQFYYNPSHLSRLFVRQTGKTFYVYLTELRLKKAMPLLQTGMDISQISDQAGFPNQRAFSQAFQRRYHQRPSQYRSEHPVSAGLPREETKTVRESLLRARNEGLFAILETESAPPPDPAQVLDYGSFSLTQGEELRVCACNNVLTVDRVRDLLLSPVLEMVKEAARDLGFTYLTCHGFQADDLQIASLYRGPRVPEGPRDSSAPSLLFGFGLYETILQRVQSTGLRMIIQLGYTPSMLAPEGAELDPIHRSCICMPASMEEWNRYIRELFTFLRERFGPWLSTCRITLWQVPDVHCLIMKKVKPEDYFLLYENTWRTVKEILPDISFESPTLTITRGGRQFLEMFLDYCAAHSCVPDALNFTHYYRGVKGYAFRDPFVESAGFMEETRALLKARSLPALPCSLLEYTYGFGDSPICDSSAGALFPLHMTIENHSLFRDFGYYCLSDFTTGRPGRGQLFFGGHGLLTARGTKKAAYFSLRFLHQLGRKCLGKEDGLLISRGEHSVQLLLYYDIPPASWQEEVPSSLSFYEGYPVRRILLTLTGLEENAPEKALSLLVKESWLNHREGSAYEAWLRSGEALFAASPGTPYTSQPLVRVRREEAQNGSFTYQCEMLPFEIRLVEIFF